MAKIATVWFNKKGTNIVHIKLGGKLYKTEVKVPRTHLISGHKVAPSIKNKLIEEAIRADLGCGVVVADNLKQYEHNGVRFQYGK